MPYLSYPSTIRSIIIWPSYDMVYSITLPKPVRASFISYNYSETFKETQSLYSFFLFGWFFVFGLSECPNGAPP